MRDLCAGFVAQPLAPSVVAEHLPLGRLAAELAKRWRPSVALLLGIQARWPARPELPIGVVVGRPTMTMGSGYQGMRSQAWRPG